MIKVALLGSTGSIGTQVANVVRRYSDRFELVSLTAHKNARVFLKQIEEFKPRVACITENIEIPDNLKSHTQFFVGENSFIEGIIDECDVVVVALVGFVGIHAVIKAIEKGKKIALANKESLVVGGGIIMPMAKEKGVEIVPIDSEHSAIWQALNFDKEKDFEKLIRPASGGALRNVAIKDLEKVSV